MIIVKQGNVVSLDPNQKVVFGEAGNGDFVIEIHENGCETRILLNTNDQMILTKALRAHSAKQISVLFGKLESAMKKEFEES